MRVWAVTLSFAGGGPLILNTLAAPSAEAAAAMTMLGVCRMEVPAQELQGVGCVEMPADWLRWALKTIETGEPHKAPVVSLVPSEPHPGLSFCTYHGVLIPLGGQCLMCTEAQLNRPVGPLDPA
jgi:hypothetical protein